MRFLLFFLLLTSCTSLKTNKEVSRYYVEDALVAKFPQISNHIFLDDSSYTLVDLDQMRYLADLAWRPWISQKGDCDDQVSRALFKIREKFYEDNRFSFAPAIGRLDCVVEGENHGVLWFLTRNGLFFYDQTRQRFLEPQFPKKVHDK